MASQMSGILQKMGLRRAALVGPAASAGAQALQPAGDAPFDLPSALAFCLALTESLREVHQHTELHHAVCPGNIRFGEDGTVELRQDASMPLGYVSPEQTGRMNRGVDYRSDYYSLGVVFYELLADHLPFESDNVMELVHSHIAKKAVPPIQHNPEIPKPLSDIVMKLLAKNAEDRYQSLQGVAADLRTCQSALQESGTIAPFELARQDRCDRLQLPQKLYGRERQIEIMLEAFERVAAGTAELLLLTGYAGIGKSSLVHEIHKPVVAQHGYFAVGKFDQFKRGIPYYAVAHAFRELIHQILTESESRIAAWKANILQALGTNGQVMIDAIPDLELLIGRQPATLQLAPAEAQNRFVYVMQSFIGVIARPQHPLVIFLDDLQWADEASLKLLHFFQAGSKRTALLLIGAYRDNEVDAADALPQTLASIAQRTRVTTLEVGALQESDVGALLADTVKTSSAAVQRLAQLIFRKTLGNPFFVGQFIKDLHAEKLLRCSDGRWQWDIDQIEAMAITDNVVDLLTRELERLPPATRQIVMLASCIGNSFDLPMLATVAEKTRADARTLLAPALQAGLIMSSEAGFGAAQGTLPRYRFSHDRVQQAAYGGIPEEDRKAVHLQIGRLLFYNTPEQQQDELLLEIVQQLNEGRELLGDEPERIGLAELNLRAAIKGKAAVAHQTALKHASIGLALLDQTAQKGSPLYFSLQIEQMDANFMGHQFSEVDRIGASILKHPLDILQRARVQDVLLQSCLYQDRHVDALALALETLRMLGLEPPTVGGKLRLMLRAFKLKRMIGARSTAEFLTLPPQKDSVELLKQQILNRATSASYVANPELFSILTLERLHIMLRSGRSTPLLPNSLLGYAMVQIQGFGALRYGGELGDLALALARNKLLTQQQDGYGIRDMFVIYALIAHWKEHLRGIIVPLQENYRAGLQVGEFEYAVYSLLASLRAELIVGRKLPSLLERMQQALNKSDTLKQKTSSDAMRINIRFVSALMGLPITDRNGWIEGGNATRLTLLHWHLFEAARHYLFSDFDAALDSIANSESYVASAACMATLPLYQLYHALCLLAVYPTMDAVRRGHALDKLDGLQRKLKLWAKHAPMNHLHKWQLVEAERCRVLGKPGKAERYFNLAIKGAHANGYLNDEALSNELASRFYQGLGRDMHARMHLEEAHAKYAEWGAAGKMQDLERRYPRLLSRAIGRGLHDALPAGQRIDIETVIQASQTLSSEIQLDKLLKKLMLLLIENAGAQKGVLLLQKDGILMLQARGQDDAVEVLQRRPFETEPNLSHAIINYVARTRELVVLGDAGQDSRFSGDEYIQRAQPKSVLCMPLEKQGAVVGVLYFENNLANDAFTAERTGLLGILSTQIAISLENAELYDELEQKIEARTFALNQKNAELGQTLSSLKKMQKQLVESEKLASLGQLVAGIAHEINTPVGVGVTGASTLLEETGKLLARYRDGSMKRSDLDHYVETAAVISKLLLSNMERAALLIQSFKEVAIDQTSEERRSFRLKPYIDEVLLNLSPTLRRAERTVTLDCDEQIEIDSYPGALAQILTNFVMNALLHAFQEGQAGTMAIVVSLLDADTVQLRFSDTGKGIPEKDLPKIFDPFFTTMRGRGGSGLGLNIVHNLVTGSLQGRVSVQSTINVGTTFILDFPRNPVGKSPAVEAAHNSIV